MSLAYVVDDLFLGHRPPRHHPERPERLEAVRDALAEAHIADRALRLPTRPAREEELGGVHTPAYVAELSRVMPGASGMLDEDTFFSPGSWEAVLAAAGAAVRSGAGLGRGAGAARPRRRPPAGTPRRARPGHGVLPVQQRGGGRGRRARRRLRPRGDRRLGRAPRKRDPGGLLARSDGAVLLDTPVSLLPGLRRLRRDRRRGGGGRHGQRAAARGIGRRRVRGRLRRGDRARAAPLPPRSGAGLGGVRRVRRRSAREHARQRRRL